MSSPSGTGVSDGRNERSGRRVGGRVTARVFAAAVACAAAAGCSDPMDPGDPIDALPRQLSTAESAVIDASTGFGLRLLRETVAVDERPNVVLSPLSASMALGMTLNGADGTTFDAMRSALGFGSLSREEINQAYADLIELLGTLDPEVRFEIANAVWTNQDVEFHAAFMDAVAEAFQAETSSSDFSDPATLDAINGWVEDATDGTIDSILDSLDPDLVALLLNAIYFEGAWTVAFDPADTSPADFTRADGTTVEVEMMSVTDEEYALAWAPEYAAAELPYGGGAFTMVVVVPSGDARDFARSLDGDGWQEVVDGLAPAEVDRLALPRFTLTYDGFLNEALKAMGMEEAFRDGADFTRMSPVGDQLCIDFVRQKTFIEVDERGTRAAAVTAVGVGPTSFTGLVADRPFLFAVRERFSGAILFTGLVGDPTADDPGPEPYLDSCG